MHLVSYRPRRQTDLAMKSLNNCIVVVGGGGSVAVVGVGGGGVCVERENVTVP